jgi:hypothetical protein
MKWRLLLLGAGVLALVGVAGLLVLWFTTPEPGVTKANYRRLGVGMTEAEVEHVLGRQGKLIPTGGDSTVVIVTKEWYEGDLGIVLWLDSDHRLMGGSCFIWPEEVRLRLGPVEDPGEPLPDHLSIFDRLRRLLGL